MKNRDVEFLFEVGSLRQVPRAWQQILTGKVQNISEHSFRTTLIAWIIACAEGANVEKVLKMSLLHDIPESRTGDIAFMHRDYVERNERLAIQHIFERTILESEAAKLLKEYDKRNSLEAKIVKDADNLDVDLELKELDKIGDTSAKGMRTIHRPIIRHQKLHTKTAKKMWDIIQKTNPNDWHQALTNKYVKQKHASK